MCLVFKSAGLINNWSFYGGTNFRPSDLALRCYTNEPQTMMPKCVTGFDEKIHCREIWCVIHTVRHYFRYLAHVSEKVNSYLIFFTKSYRGSLN